MISSPILDGRSDRDGDWIGAGGGSQLGQDPKVASSCVATRRSSAPTYSVTVSRNEQPKIVSHACNISDTRDTNAKRATPMIRRRSATGYDKLAGMVSLKIMDILRLLVKSRIRD